MRGWIWSLVLAATPVFADGGCAPGIGPIDSATPTTPEGPVLETPLRPAFDQPLPARVETATFGLG